MQCLGHAYTKKLQCLLFLFLKSGNAGFERMKGGQWLEWSEEDKGVAGREALGGRINVQGLVDHVGTSAFSAADTRHHWRCCDF